MTQICVFKEKRKEGGNERCLTWWPMKGSMLGCFWNVPCLVVNGRFQASWPLEREGEASFSLLPLFTPKDLT
jgi:hypothetical protein